MPNLSVRNLVEAACVPPLLAGCWQLIKNDQPNWKDYLIGGFLFGFAFFVQVSNFTVCSGYWPGIVILAPMEGCFYFQHGVFAERIFVSVYNRFGFMGLLPSLNFLVITPRKYNIVNRGAYFSGYWFNYLLLVTGLVIPPFSLLLWFGYF